MNRPIPRRTVAARVALTPILLVLLVVVAAPLAHAQETPIGYTLRFPAPHTHYVDVEARLPTEGQPTVDVLMAVWTPGSYLVREFARHVEDLTARSTTGTTLAVATTDKNRWRVTTDGADPVVVTYRVYSREMSVRTNWVEQDFALLNGAPTFLTLADGVARPHDVRLELPAHWSDSATALPPAPGGESHAFRAADFDTLVDSPIVAGDLVRSDFEVDDVPHALVHVGDAALWDTGRAAADVERVVETQRDLWGHLPYERYLFLNVISEAGGGLEHRDSTVLMTSRWTMRDPERYRRWLTLVSHELFHAWNGKRLRPVELGPFDYERENYTRSLWMTEGLTVYYGALLVHRAGLSTREQYLDALSSEIRSLQTTPGRLVQPVEQASFDAWIRYYRRNENSRNTTVSYYTKGAVIGFLLDARVRRASGGRASLDDVLRLAYARHADDRGFTPAEMREAITDAVGVDVDLTEWLTDMLETTVELDYREAEGWFGLDLARPDEAPTEDDEGGAPTAPAWLGLRVRSAGDNVVVAEVPRDTPAATAGFNVGDEVVAIDGYRVHTSDWRTRLALYTAGEEATVLVARRDRLTPLPVVFGAPPAPAWALSLRDSRTSAQRYRVDAWLGALAEEP